MASDEGGAAEGSGDSAAESAGNKTDIVSGLTRPGSPKPFDIIEYDDKAPGFQKHHGVLDVWAQNNIPGYNSYEAPTMVLTANEHNATRSVFAQWRLGRTGSITGYIDWKIVSPQEIQELAYNMFDAAGAPEGAVQDYFRAFNRFIYGP